MAEIVVLMPINKVTPFILPAVESILSKVGVDFLLRIAVNNCTTEVLTSIKNALGPLGSHPQVEVDFYGSGSLGRIRGNALAEVEAEYIALLDSDDIADPRRLSSQALFLRENPQVGAVGSFVNLINSNGEIVGFRKMPRRKIRGQQLLDSPLIAPSVMIRAQAYKQVGGFKEGNCEDFDLWRRLLKVSSLSNLMEPLTSYRIHPGQSGQEFRTLQADCRIKSILQDFGIPTEPEDSIDALIGRISLLRFAMRLKVGICYIFELPIPRKRKIALLVELIT